MMVAMDLTRFAAVMSVPAAFALGWLGFGQLLVVSIIVAATDIAFKPASGACLTALVRSEDLLVAMAARSGPGCWEKTRLLMIATARRQLRPDASHRSIERRIFRCRQHNFACVLFSTQTS